MLYVVLMICFCVVVFLPIQPSGKGPRLPEVYCVISRLGCFDLFSTVSIKLCAKAVNDF